ncbi:MAG: DUF4278 domain-containing protein [Nostocales cyanobacterium 94392]|nr:DUF4278 domain-containing protein [Nostocales cyanobacterium 94392]
MPLFFLIPLFICVITGYIFKKCSDEVGYLAGLFAIISLVLSLILAPWEIQVLLLVVVLVTTKKLLQQNEYQLKFEERDHNYHQNQTVSPSETVKKEVTRQYRGTNYQVDIVNTEIIEEEVKGKYRGTPWIIRRVKTIVNRE